MSPERQHPEYPQDEFGQRLAELDAKAIKLATYAQDQAILRMSQVHTVNVKDPAYEKMHSALTELDGIITEIRKLRDDRSELVNKVEDAVQSEEFKGVGGTANDLAGTYQTLTDRVDKIESGMKLDAKEFNLVAPPEFK